MDTFGPWLHDNWMWLAIIFLLITLRDGIRSLNSGILDIREQTRKSAECLFSIDHKVGLIQDRLHKDAKRRRRRLKPAKLAFGQPLQAPQPPKRPRTDCYERLQKVKDFVERSGGFMEQTGNPNEVWFSLPGDAKDANETLEANGIQPIHLLLLKATDGHSARMIRQYKVNLNLIDDDGTAEDDDGPAGSTIG